MAMSKSALAPSSASIFLHRLIGGEGIQLPHLRGTLPARAGQFFDGADRPFDAPVRAKICVDGKQMQFSTHAAPLPVNRASSRSSYHDLNVLRPREGSVSFRKLISERLFHIKTEAISKRIAAAKIPKNGEISGWKAQVKVLRYRYKPQRRVVNNLSNMAIFCGCKDSKQFIANPFCRLEFELCCIGELGRTGGIRNSWRRASSENFRAHRQMQFVDKARADHGAVNHRAALAQQPFHIPLLAQPA